MVCSRQPPRQGILVTLFASRTTQRLIAVVTALCLLFPLALPALSDSSPNGSSGQSTGDDSPDEWPPAAWRNGDVSSLSLVELALLANDLGPSQQNRESLEASLAVLDNEEIYGEEHKELTRVVLEGLAKARWHQVQAMRDLSEEQLRIIASADPDAPLPDGWNSVMATVHHEELKNALLAMESASTRALAIFESLKDEPAKPGLAQMLASETGIPVPDASPELPTDIPAIEATAALIEQVAIADVDPQQVRMLQESLVQMPPEGRRALHVIFEGLLPFSLGAPADPERALVELGAAVDAAEDTLKIWSTAAMAHQVHHVGTGPGIQIPDADTDRPPLHFGLPRLRSHDAPLPPSPSLPEAVRDLALALGDHETARHAEDRAAAMMQALGSREQEAVAQMLSQGARYIETHQRANQVQPPAGFAQNPGILDTWAGFLDDGLPEPGSTEAQQLIATRGYLKAQLEAMLAREDLMTAVQEAVLALTPGPAPQSGSPPSLPQQQAPASSPTEEAGVECPVEGIMTDLQPLLAIEPCGTDTEWVRDEHYAAFVIDVGGNDTYKGPFGAAPIELEDPGPMDIPIAIHLDLGGSDTYNATGHECALGAGCEAEENPLIPLIGIEQVPLIGILADWSGDNGTSENRFIGGDRSQGYGNGALMPGTGLLIERVGEGSVLDSTYQAGNYSQGSVESASSSTVSTSTGSAVGVGALIRLVGAESNATGRFQAGDHAQGSLDGAGGSIPGGGVGVLLNMAGPGASSPDHYQGGTFVQGATSVEDLYSANLVGNAQLNEDPIGVALFADIVGSGGRSDDVYDAVNKTRAYGSGAFFLDVLLPESVEQEGLVEATPDAEPPEMPDPSDLPDPDDADLPGPPEGPGVGNDTRPSLAVSPSSTGPRSRSDDVYRLEEREDPRANGWAIPSLEGDLTVTLFLDAGGNDTYPEEGAASNENIWTQPEDEYFGFGNDSFPVTGIDTRALMDEDGDFFPRFLEEFLGTSEADPGSGPPTGYRVVLDQGSEYPFFDGPHAFVLTLTGDNTYGSDFSSAVLLDLGGDNKHFGRTAAATGPTAATSSDTFPAAAQNLLSFTLDLDGDDFYKTETPGSLGFGAGHAAGILFDMGGNDRYNGTAYTQGVGVEGGIGALADLSVANESELNRFRADRAPNQGHGADNGIGILVADGDHNTFEDGEKEFKIRDLWDQLRGLLPGLNDDPGGLLPDEAEPVENVLDGIEELLESQGVDLISALDDLREELNGDQKEILDDLEDLIFDEEGNISGTGASGVESPGGIDQSGDGGFAASVNMGDNDAPNITEWTVVEPGQGQGFLNENPQEWIGSVANGPPDFLRAGVPYRFTATVEDSEEDRLEFCWEFGRGVGGEDDVDRECRFSEGSGTVEVEYTWEEVHTDGRVDDLQSHHPYWFNVTVTDPGGQWVAQYTSADVENRPLDVGGLRGPRIVETGEHAAYQLPFTTENREEDLPLEPGDIVTRVGWGDGTQRGEFNATGVDWAQQRWGARVTLPTALPKVPGDPTEHYNRPGANLITNMIDDETEVPTVFTQEDQGTTLGGIPDAPATALVTFDGPRQIRQISLEAALGENNQGPIRLSVDGIRADGSLFPLTEKSHGSPGIIRLEETFNRTVWDLVDFPDLEGLVVRQVDTDPDVRRAFQVRELTARGPGAIKEGWGIPTTFDLEYTVLDRYEGQNGTTVPISVVEGETAAQTVGPGENDAGGTSPGTASPVGVDDAPVTLADIGDRGPVKQASLIMRNPNYPLVVNLTDVSRDDKLCIDWTGDGNAADDCLDVGLNDLQRGQWQKAHTWQDPGTFNVSVHHTPAGTDQVDVYPLTTVHVEPGIDLRPEDPDGEPVPILFMTFAPGETWHEGIDYPTIVDAGGNDRYYGRVAASVPEPMYTGSLHPVVDDDDEDNGGDRFIIGAPGVPVPGLLLKAGGDDLYVSDASRTQAYATHFGVALHFDTGGDDTYVAAGEAQAAAERGGVAALVSLGGNDRFNPVPSDHPLTHGASATNPEPVPYESFRVARAIGKGPDFVQGATEDGVAILLTKGSPLGSTGFFHAGARAQGYGAHLPGVQSADHYALAGTLEECNDSFSLNPGNPTSSMLDPLYVTCLLGIDNVQDPIQNPGFYTSIDDQDGMEPFWCTFDGGQIVPILVFTCPSASPDTTGLAQFLAEGPRYSPGLGVLVNSGGGPAFYHAGMEAQGSARPDARGFLLNLNGPSAVLSGNQSQAFSHAGLAGTVLGEASVMRLGSDGQAFAVPLEDETGPEGLSLITGALDPEVPPEALREFLRTAVLLTVNRDERCDTDCGGDDPLEDLQQGAFNLNLEPPAPEVDVTIDGSPREFYDMGDRVGVNVAIGDEGDPMDLSFGHNVTALAIAYPDGQEEDNEWRCSGAPLAAPAIVGQGHDVTKFELDLGAMVAGTDPLFPAGCTEVHVFARSAAEDGVPFGASGWGHGSASVLSLPPPRLDIESLEPLHTHGEPVDINMTIPEPLAEQEGLLHTDLRIIDESDTVVEQWDGLQGHRLNVTWEPAEGLEGGNFSMDARFKWEGDFGVDPPLSKWIPLRESTFEPLIPQELVQEPVPTNPMHIVRDGPIALTGTTSGWQENLTFRLLDENGGVAEIRPWLEGACLGASDKVDNVSARLRGNPAATQPWDTTFCLPSPGGDEDYGPGDEFIVQFRFPDSSEEDEWLDLQNQGVAQRVRFVSDTTVKRVVAPDTDAEGTQALGTSDDPVKMCVIIGHDGIDLQPRDVLVTVLSIGDDQHLKAYTATPDPSLECPGARTDEDPASVEAFGYLWHGLDDQPLAEAGANLEYRVYALVRDDAGGLFDHNPAFDFPVDRTRPDIFDPTAVLPERTVPDPANGTVRTEKQTALKPGDVVELSVHASDPNLHRVEASAGDQRVELAQVNKNLTDLFEGALILPQDPDNLTISDALDEDGRLPITARAIDRAGRDNSTDVVSPLLHAEGFSLDGDIDVEERSESVRLEWTLDRSLDLEDPGNGMIAVLQDETGDHNLSFARVTAVSGLEGNYTVTFTALKEDTPYQVALLMWDGAGWELTPEPAPLRTLELPLGTRVEITTDPEPTYSGEVAVRGSVTAGTADITGDLELHLAESEAGEELIGSVSPFEVFRGDRREFEITWDTRGQVPDSVGARHVDVQVRFSDGDLAWTDEITLRIDNTPPQNMTLDVVGPDANQGWNNGTIVVGVTFDDDTSPFTRFIEVADVTDGAIEQDTVTLAENGIYSVNFTVEDGAIPPNVAHLEETVRVDRTLPELNVTLGLDNPWTKEDEVPIEVEASDNVSGLDGVRVRAGDLPWTGWSKEMPTNVTLQGLDDGEYWIEIEARDQAHNVRREAFTVVHDRTPPLLVDARWVGWTQESDPRPVLHVVARDELDGAGLPSGMDAIRFSPTHEGPWTGWHDMGTSGTFPINETRSGTVWSQMRDRATNVADPVRVEGPLAAPVDAQPEEIPPDAPASALLRDLSFAPKEGGPDTPFTFIVRVHPLDQALPGRVLLHIAGESHEMEREGPALQGGARIHTVTVTLPPSQLESPHTFTVSAVYADHEVETSERTGPTVLRLGTDPVTAQQEEEAGQGFPIPATPPLLITLALLVFLAWRRKANRPLIPTWRKDP